MKKISLILLAVLFSAAVTAQTKEKLKGSKIVTIEQKEVENFEGIEVHDDLEISLIKGEKPGVEIEADDNLHQALGLDMNGSVLILSMAKEISGAKKFSIRITYSDSFKSVVAKNDSKINALEEVKLDEITFSAFDNAKLYLNINSKSFTLLANDKSKVEFNCKSESCAIELSKSAELKALISSTEMKCDLYQKAKATIEGDVIDMKLRLDNNSTFNGNKLTAKNVAVVAEGYTNCSLFAETSLSIEASGNTEIQLFGEPKIDMKGFAGSATLHKKATK